MSLLLCYITDRHHFPGDEISRSRLLLEKITKAARCGVDFIQLREKDLAICDLEILARRAVETIHNNRGAGNTRLLINSRSDVAVACGADGVHLRVDDISPSEVRNIWKKADVTIGVSCHSVEEISRAAKANAMFTVFGPVFEKVSMAGIQPIGLEMLVAACWQKIPVLALGGVNLKNASLCMTAGAAGVAGIRLFQEGDLEETVRKLRGLA